MTAIDANTIDTYRGGDWRLMYAVTGGTMPRITKDHGVVDVPYRAGDVLLANGQDHVIAGPISLAGAVDLAERIMDGDQRARTDPSAMLTLCAAVVGFAAETDPVPETIEVVLDVPVAAPTPAIAAEAAQIGA